MKSNHRPEYRGLRQVRRSPKNNRKVSKLLRLKKKKDK